MKTFRIVIPLLGGLALTTPCVADPASLLGPDDPSRSSGWRPPESPTAGLKPFKPAETKDWLQLNRNVTPNGGSMGGMKGMNGKPTPSGASSTDGAMKDMPGMSGMPGMGTMK